MVSSKKDERSKDFTRKEWYIFVEEQEFGPYGIEELRVDLRFTPDTPARKSKDEEWVPARFISELQEVFKDRGKPRPHHGMDEEEEFGAALEESQIVLRLQPDPYHYFLWILLLITLLYSSYYFYLYN